MAVALVATLSACRTDLGCDSVGWVEQHGECIPFVDLADSGNGGTDASRDAGDSGPDADAGCDAPVTYYADQDGDNLGDPAMGRDLCAPEDGWVTNPDDPQPLCPNGEGDGCTADADQCIADGDTFTRQRCTQTDSRGCTAWQADPCPATDPLCDEADATCGRCEDDGDCAAFSDTSPVCDTDTGTCVECAPGLTDFCGNRACNALTHLCSDYTPANQKACEPCDADEACEGGMFCVEMLYQGEPHGAYCLRESPPCEQPFFKDLANRASLSDPTLRTFCGIEETLVTCEAVRALIDNETCDTKACPESGFCRRVGSLDNRCSYECGNAEQCLSPGDSVPRSTCGNANHPDGGVDYCGGG